MNNGNKKIMVIAVAMVMALGFVMLYKGMTTSGINSQAKLPSGIATNAATVENGVQNIETKLSSRGYPAITVTKGVPVRWNMKADAADINGCNGTLVIQQFNIEKKLVPGDNIIEFTPTTTGSIPYSCWMGMIRSNINVVEGTGDKTSSASSAVVTQSPTSQNSTSTSNATGAVVGAGAGAGCCGGGAASVKAPSDITIQKAIIKNGVQTITVDVDTLGYTPTLIVMEKGIKTKIKFNVKQLSGCNNQVYFSQGNMSLDFSKNESETPYFTPKADIQFSCGMGMLNGYIKVVPNLEKADMNKIKTELLGN